MQDYTVETTVSEDGSVTVTGLPFVTGDRVEVTIRCRAHPGEERKYALRGKPFRYTDPFGSVAEGGLGSAQMIILDTHIWVWWVHGDNQLSEAQKAVIESNEADVIGVCAISVWEIAKLVEYKRLELPCPVHEWFDIGLNYPGVGLIELSPEVAMESCRLPGAFHRDPADQIIVATARIFDCPLVTSDTRIRKYPYVRTGA